MGNSYLYKCDPDRPSRFMILDMKHVIYCVEVAPPVAESCIMKSLVAILFKPPIGKQSDCMIAL